jgi:hypothetical protein
LVLGDTAFPEPKINGTLTQQPLGVFHDVGELGKTGQELPLGHHPFHGVSQVAGLELAEKRIALNGP